MAEQVENGASIAEVSQATRASTMLVRYACEEFGVPVRRAHRRPAYGPAGALRIYAAICRAAPGDTLQAVGERLGVTKQRVWQVCQNAWRLGLKTGRWLPPAEPPTPLDSGKILT